MNKTEWILLAILLIALFIRFSGAIYFPAFSGADEWFHYEIILHYQEGSGYAEGLAAYYPATLMNDYYAQNPVYYSLMSFFKDFYFIRVIQAVIGTMSLFIAFKLIKLISNFKTGLYVTAFLAFLPTFIIQSSTINPDVLCALFGFLMFYFLFKEIKQHSFNHLALASLFFGLAFSTKLVSIGLMIPLMAGITYSTHKHEDSSINYLVFPVLLIAFFFLHNLRYLSWGGTIGIQSIQDISVNWFSKFFAGFWLQEYGTALIPDIRYLFFYFYLTCFIVFVFFALRKSIQFTPINSIIIISIASMLLGMIYLSVTGFQARYIFAVLPFIPFAYFKLVESPFWRNAMIYSLILFTTLLFASISSVPVCVPYPVPYCQ